MLPDGPEGGSEENCMFLDYETLRWDDAYCLVSFSSICECKLNDCKYS